MDELVQRYIDSQQNGSALHIDDEIFLGLVNQSSCSRQRTEQEQELKAAGWRIEMPDDDEDPQDDVE